ncbi:Rop family plasmid primer RNA-binding protein [Candidatus Arsenophonus triatominarum]
MSLEYGGFIKSQTLILLDKLNLGDCADECEDSHNMAEELYFNLKRTLER